MLNKKGQGISINVIIIAAIALLVLVILSVLLLRGGGTIVEGTSCLGVGGQCEANCGDISTGTETYGRHSTAACDDPAEVCCVKIG
ncbi:MAG: hypothetical protein ABH828_02740 [archaeon]